MDSWKTDPHLNDMSTLWSVVHQAHQGPGEIVAGARRLLLQRYSGAVYRYLRGVLRDADAVDDLYQEFALRLLRGDFHRASPECGRFRNYVKTALFRLVIQHHRNRLAQPVPLTEEDPPAPAWTGTDEEFLRSWREDLLARAWDGLAQREKETGQPFHTVLRFRVENPDLSSPEMAELLGTLLGKPVTAAAGRQLLHRAREKFSDLLLDAVTQSLKDPTADQVEQELMDLNLLQYCRPALERFRGS